MGGNERAQDARSRSWEWEEEGEYVLPIPDEAMVYVVSESLSECTAQKKGGGTDTAKKTELLGSVVDTVIALRDSE